VIDVDNILFGSEMVGAVRGIDPTTGYYFDDTKRYVDAVNISDTQREQVFSGNVRRIYPRLDASLKTRGL
jgi:4-oxalmesaconate hydratase